MTLKEIAVGQTVKVKKLTGEGPVKRRINPPERESQCRP